MSHRRAADHVWVGRHPQRGVPMCACGAIRNRAMRLRELRESRPGYWEGRACRSALGRLRHDARMARQRMCAHANIEGTHCYCSFTCHTPEACTRRCADCGATL